MLEVRFQSLNGLGVEISDGRNTASWSFIWAEKLSCVRVCLGFDVVESNPTGVFLVFDLEAHFEPNHCQLDLNLVRVFFLT